MQQPFTHALVADLLTVFESANGTPLGVATHLQVQELLKLLGEDTKPERLKTLLSPILCKDKGDQSQFYAIFDKSLQQQIEVEKELDKLISDYSQPPMWKWNWATVAIIFTLIVSWTVGYLSGPAVVSPKEIQFDNPTFVPIRLGDPIKTYTVEALKWDRHSANRLAELYQIKGDNATDLHVDAPAGKIYYSSLRVGVDTVSLCVHFRSKIWRHQIIFSVQDTTTTRVQTTQKGDIYVKQEIRHKRDLTKLESPIPTAAQLFLLDYEYPIKAVAILLSGLLLWLFLRRLERKPERIIAEFKPNIKSPYTWKVNFEQPKIIFSELYRDLLQKFRRRENDDLWRLDLPKTIKATVNKGGLLQFQFTHRTRPAEYLLLIDRHNARNHQDRNFDMLYRAFKSQDVLVERFWMDEGDPRHVWNEKHPKGLSLRNLHSLHPQSRVLLISPGYQLLSNDPTRNIVEWAEKNFSTWQNRGVLTTVPLSDFGRRERRLQELFQVLPASLTGLREALELFNEPDRTLNLDPRRFPDAAQVPVQMVENDLIKTIQHYFKRAKSVNPKTPISDDSINQLTLWVAACAVHPELHWDLTLYLGQLLSNEKNKLLTTENLIFLSRFPWFVEGRIPLEARKLLIAWLERDYEGCLFIVRNGLHNILQDEKNIPTIGSIAHDHWKMNLLLNEWLYTPNPIRKKELEDEIKKRIAAGQQADFMVLRIFNPNETLTPEQFEVSEDWKKELRTKAMTQMRPIKHWKWALPLWLILCAGMLAWTPEKVGCQGISIGNNWCAETLDELLQIKEMLALEALGNSNLAKADSLKNEILTLGRKESWKNKAFAPVGLKPIIIDSNTYFQNLAVGYFNQGVAVRDSAVLSEIQDKVSPGFGPRAREAENTGCPCFLRAEALNALLSDNFQYWVVREAAARCSPRPSPSKDLYLRGRLFDAATNQAIGAISQAKVESQGFQPGIVANGGYFSLELPDDWVSPVKLVVTVPGYEPYSGTVNPESFDKSIIIRLKIEIDCYAQMISQGHRAMQETDYVRAAELFRAAKNCIDADAQRRKAASDLIVKARDAAEAQLIASLKDIDRDEDGVPNVVDKCPDEKGTVGNDGCPIIREQLLGFWLLEAVELGQSVKILIDIRNDGQIAYEFLGQKYQLEQSFINRWNVKDKIFTEPMEGRADVKCSIEKLDNQNFVLKIIDNGNPGKVGLIRNYRRIQPIDRDSDKVFDEVDYCPDEKGEKIKGGCPEITTDFDSPKFPFPPPQPSSSITLSRDLFSKSRTLGDVEIQLAKALNQKGYNQRSYLSVPNGFALVTQLEQFDKDGNSMTGSARWSNNPPDTQFENVWDYLKNLLTPADGNFRVFVFIVTDLPYSFPTGSSGSGSDATGVSIKESRGWLSQGLNRFPLRIAKMRFPESYEVTALVYEYKIAVSNKLVSQSLPGLFPSVTHLTKSGILDALRK